MLRDRSAVRAIKPLHAVLASLDIATGIAQDCVVAPAKWRLPPLTVLGDGYRIRLDCLRWGVARTHDVVPKAQQPELTYNRNCRHRNRTGFAGL